MDELSHVLSAVARLVVVLGGGLSTVMVAYAGIKWMTSAGDAQEMSKARMALLGALGGLVLVGVGFVGPRVVNDVVVRPVGGVSFDMDVGFNCDQVLRDQLVFQRGASTAERMNRVIRVIQSQRRDCPEEVWDPHVDNGGYTVVVGGGSGGGAGPCFTVPLPVGDDARIGGLVVPRSLRLGNDMGNAPRENSGRDADNNIMVYRGNADRRPSDSSACWLYISRLRLWEVNY